MAAHDRRISVSDILRGGLQCANNEGKKEPVGKTHRLSNGLSITLLVSKLSNATSHHQPRAADRFDQWVTSSSLNCFPLPYLCHKRFSRSIKAASPAAQLTGSAKRIDMAQYGIERQRVQYGLIGNKRAQRHTASKALTQEQYVWYDIKLFKSPEAAVSSEATLYLIQYQ